MKLKHYSARKLVCPLLWILVILLAGCSAAAAPDAVIPAAAIVSDDLPAVTGSEPKAEPISEEINVTPTLSPQTADPALTPSPTMPHVEISPAVQGSDIPTPPPVQPSVTPVASVTPSVTPAPDKAPEVKTKSDEVVYPINSFKNDSVLCLTFDDGGNKKAVQKTLEVLEQYDIQCTFFVIGKYLKPYADLWKQAIDQGHQICNHTQNHKWLSDLSTDEAKKEILAWEASATEALGEEYLQKMKKEFPYIRLPGGAGSKSKRVMGILSDLGYTPVGWNIESYYAVLRNHDLKNDPLADITDEVTAHITKKASAGSIVLLHFNPYDTTKLDAILDGILAKKLTMELLSEQGL